MKYEIVPAEQEHLDHLAAHMREEDRLEVWRAHRHTPAEALRVSEAVSRDTFAGLADGECMCVFGVGEVSFISLDGSPWLLGHEDLPKHARPFLKMSRAYIDDIKWSYRRLVNFADAGNTQSLKWLKWMGFTIHPAKPFGHERAPFHKFEWVRAENV